MVKFRESGRSMIEMLGVLAVIGVLSAGGIWGYNQAVTQYRVNQTIDDIQTTLTAAKGIFIGKPSSPLTYISAKQLQEIGVIPKRYKLKTPEACIEGDAATSGACALTSLFGEKLIIYLNDGHSVNYKIMSVIIYTPKTSVCTKLLSHNWLNTVPRIWWGLGKHDAYIKQGRAIPAPQEITKEDCEKAEYIYFSFWLNYKGIN